MSDGLSNTVSKLKFCVCELFEEVNSIRTILNKIISDGQEYFIKRYTTQELPFDNVKEGTLAYDTTLEVYVYYKDGVWYRVSDDGEVNIGNKTTDELPYNVSDGAIAFDTTLGEFVYFDQGIWKKVSDNTQVADRIIDIFLLAGQSNALGYSLINGNASYSGLSGDQLNTKDALFYTAYNLPSTSNATNPLIYGDLESELKVDGSSSGRTFQSPTQPSFGTEIGFASKANEISGNTGITGNFSSKIGFLKYAVGASQLFAGDPSLSDWDTDGTYVAGIKEYDCWPNFKNAISDGLSKYTAAKYFYNVKGMIWYQGESDGSKASPVGTIENKLNEFLGVVKTYLNTEHSVDVSAFPVVIVGPADSSGTRVSWSNEYYRTAYGNPNYNFIDASVYHDGSYTDVHLSAQNMYSLGEAVAGHMISAINSKNVWIPTEISNKDLWVDSADSSTIEFTGGTGVSGINDKSGRTPSLDFYSRFTSGGTGVPEYKLAQQNTFNVIDLKTRQFFQNTASITNFSTGNQTWFIAAKITNVAGNQSGLWGFQGGGSLLTLLPDSSTDFLGNWNVLSGGVFIKPFGRYSNTNLENNIHIFEINWNSDASTPANSTGTIYLDGLLINGPITANYSIKSTLTYMILFGNYSAHTLTTTPPEGELYETIVIPGSTTADRQYVEGYLTHKWVGLNNNLPSGHPYKNTPPVISALP